MTVFCKYRTDYAVQKGSLLRKEKTMQMKYQPKPERIIRRSDETKICVDLSIDEDKQIFEFF